MSYKIVITKTEENVPYTSREWKKLRDDEEKDPSGENELYGYVTAEGTHSVSNDILEQTVEELDMVAVIKAINNLV